MPNARFVLAVAFASLLLASPLSTAWPTPGLNGERTEAIHGRLFPEPLQTNDFIAYDEAVASLRLLESRHPDMMTVHVIGQSAGNVNPLTGAREPRDVLVVEVTNGASAIPYESKLKSVFLMSVHGNEKGGREGALRVIEDLVAGKGIAQEFPHLVPMLDHQVVVMVFPNPDGWVHEQVPYFVEPNPTLFTRGNGNGIDLNRQYPTKGYLDQTTTTFQTMGQPEMAATVTWLKNLTNIGAAVDVHGMLAHDNFFAIMWKEAQRTQAETVRNEILAEATKQRLNADPHFALYHNAPRAEGAWGGDNFAEWMTTFDAIGYSAPGTGGAFVVQELGLGAAGFTVEMAYNHMVFDNHYPGGGALMNDYHVRATRQMVATFMEYLDEEIDVFTEAGGQRVAYLRTPVVVTNEADDRSTYSGWFVDVAHDDEWDIVHTTFRASPAEYFDSLAAAVREAGSGTLTGYDSASAFVAALSGVDVAVVPGSAARLLEADASSLASLKAWVESGGSLVLTDEALKLLAPLGLASEGAIRSQASYAGYTDVADFTHAFLEGVRGFPRQTYDPNPLGYAQRESPVWLVDADAWNGEAVGFAHGGVNLGEAKLGSGSVRIFGAILPDPSRDNPHPYGLDGYSVSPTGNTILLNLLNMRNGWESRPLDPASLVTVEPAEAEDPAEGARGIPGAGAFMALAAIGAAAVALRRRS